MSLTTGRGPEAHRSRSKSESLLPLQSSPSASSPSLSIPRVAIPLFAPFHKPHSDPTTSASSQEKSSSATIASNSTPRAVYPRHLHHSRFLLRSVKPGAWRWLILTLTVTLSLYTLRQLYHHRHGAGAIGDYLSYADLSFHDQDTKTSVVHDQPILLRPKKSQYREAGRIEGGSRRRKSPKYEHQSTEQWLRENSFPNFDEGFDDEGLEEHESRARRQIARRPRAAIISLVRNEELDGILQSMQQLELHWNRRFGYPWIFFNERPFSEEFKAATTNATSSRTEYHLVPRSHWSTPSWISPTRYMDSLDYLGTIGVGKGHMLSYHAMIRWQSGFFYQHPALDAYDWYWRVEPDVHFFCDIPYDPFRFLAENDLIYGFNMAILDDARSFASLWSVTRDFISKNPDLVHPDADVDWLLDPHRGMEYNNCQFFSNFEIASLAFFRAEPNRKFFDHIDHSGGFFYERYGDAPVHTLSLALFARKDQVWFFRDIGYQHDTARHCPPPPSVAPNIKGSSRRYRQHRCTCEPTSLDENFYRLVPMESPQVKPRDTCIRLWLGGDWLDKKPGWSQEVERAFGGDGYGGYVLDGLS